MQYCQSVTRPSELFALFKFVSTAKSQKFDESTNVGWCYKKLGQTSRSFALVIQELSGALKDTVMVFYLVLRGLDTIEDDMSFSRDRKIEMLKSFHNYLDLPGWTFEECGEGYEKELLQNFDKVIEVYKSLDVQYQEVIQEITQKMGNGMVEFLNSEVDTLEDWNRYCFYVAGLVGVGLSKLFAISKLEDEEFNNQLNELSISMGLFLQKTNIIRDYREDIDEKRIFWPKQIWSIYSKKLEHFRDQNYSLLAVHCLNHLITNALEHVPDVLCYLAKLKNRETFTFCAIPQAMAIATFAVCYNNPDVFFGAVKIRRGESAKIFNNTKGGITELYRIFLFYATVIESKIPADDPNAAETKAIIKKIKDICLEKLPKESGFGVKEVVIGATVVASAAYLYTVYANKAQS